MRFHLFTLALAAFAGVVPAAGSATAQGPYADYNRMRAYRHFLTSPYPVRTYSGPIPGYPPGYLHQRISPRGFESYALLPPSFGYALTPGPLPPAPAPEAPPAPVPAEDGPTYPYDGGPRDPVPMPGPDEGPTATSAWLPPEAGRKWTYPAYGEAPRRAPLTARAARATRRPPRRW
jgi:hypothetical protein